MKLSRAYGVLAAFGKKNYYVASVTVAGESKDRTAEAIFSFNSNVILSPRKDKDTMGFHEV